MNTTAQLLFSMPQLSVVLEFFRALLLLLPVLLISTLDFYLLA